MIRKAKAVWRGTGSLRSICNNFKNVELAKIKGT
jgi:hypothetical protein